MRFIQANRHPFSYRPNSLIKSVIICAASSRLMSPTLYDVVPQCLAARTKVFNQREAPDAAASRAPLLAVLPASSAANQLPDRLVAGGDPDDPVGDLVRLQVCEEHTAERQS